ncbi:hypothetical protein AJ78_00388 [Emergomyces pasteurianus Ep9510]|uniref:Uncharacterized protein n=1 Tax=Emergomyces pasteurianus Ep9510 TaxID=1447872 RepID=A0A1J9PTD2_9EURO|nr:hypothetical protein AJ78_00388 [Emergomyces pasteurianus Ep9510]
MPSLHVVLRLGNNPVILQRFRALRTSSESPDPAVPGGRLGDSWTQEQDQRLLDLCKKHRHMNRHEFQETFYPNRSYFAVSKRISLAKQAERENLHLASLPLVDGSNNSPSRPNTPQYVYSDDELEDTDLEYIPGRRASKRMASSKRSDISNLPPIDTIKRKSSTENDLSRPSPPKLPKTPTSPIFTSMNPGSNITPEANIPIISKATTVLDIGNNYDNYNNHKNTEVSNFSSPSAWIVQKAKAADVLYLFEQARKCDSETKRAEDLAFHLLNEKNALDRSRDEIRQLMELQRQHDDELEKALVALLKEQEANKVLQKELNGARQLKPCEQCKTTRTAQLKLAEQLTQLKTEVDKIIVGSSQIVHPDLWRSGGMDAASARATTIIGEIETSQKEAQK